MVIDCLKPNNVLWVMMSLEVKCISTTTLKCESSELVKQTASSESETCFPRAQGNLCVQEPHSRMAHVTDVCMCCSFSTSPPFPGSAPPGAVPQGRPHQGLCLGLNTGGTQSAGGRREVGTLNPTPLPGPRCEWCLCPKGCRTPSPPPPAALLGPQTVFQLTLPSPCSSQFGVLTISGCLPTSGWFWFP